MVRLNLEEEIAQVTPKTTDIECLRGQELERGSYSKQHKLRKLPFVEIQTSEISTLSTDAIRALSAVTVTSGHNGTDSTIIDARMGTTTNCQLCPTCQQVDCPGHYGSIDLGSYTYNPLNPRLVIAVLNSVCNCCSALLLDEDTLRQKGALRLSGTARLKLIEKLSEKNVDCTHNKNDHRCLEHQLDDPELNALVVKAQAKSAPCARNRQYDKTSVKDKGVIKYKEEKASKSSIEAPRESGPVLPSVVFSILNGISDADARLLGFGPQSHPRDLVMRLLLVTPNVTRPEIPEGGRVSQDRLTMSYNRVISAVNAKSNAARNRTAQAKSSQVYGALNILMKTGGSEGGRDEHRVISLKMILQRKEGLPRQSMMASRADYNARTVLGPAAYAKIDELYIPRRYARFLVRKERVHAANQNAIKQLHARGQIVAIYRQGTSSMQWTKGDSAAVPLLGDRVDIARQDGDMIMANRQPTLHMFSMMCFRTRFWDQNTNGLPLSVTKPFNGDFDGDEVNLWAIVTNGGEADAHYILSAKNNLLQGVRASPTMGLVMDSATGSFLATYRNELLDLTYLERYRKGMLGAFDLDNHLRRCAQHGLEPYCAAAIWSTLLPNDMYHYRKARRTDEPALHIMDGLVLSGYVTAKDVGTGAKSIVHRLILDYGQERAYQFLSDAVVLVGRYLNDHEFSVGLDDLAQLTVTEEGNLINESRELMQGKLDLMRKTVYEIGEPERESRLQAFRERQTVEAVNLAEGSGMLISRRFFERNGRLNALGVMTERGAGTKGSLGNMGQMVGIVGQQFHESDRYARQLANGTRSLSYFAPGDLDPRSRGLVTQSLYEGTDPAAFYWIQSSGRSSLAKGSLETSVTGALQRALMKATESCLVGPDGALRDTSGRMLCPLFNNGFNPDRMLLVDDVYQLSEVSHVADSLNAQQGWVRRARYQAEPVAESYFGRVPPKAEATPEYNPNHLSKYERSRLAATRADQIENGDRVLIQTRATRALDIAIEELDQGKCPLQTVRHYPDGSELTITPTLANLREYSPVFAAV